MSITIEEQNLRRLSKKMTNENNTQEPNGLVVLKKVSEKEPKTETWVKKKFLLKNKLDKITKTKQTVTTEELINATGKRIQDQLGKIQYSRFLRDVNCESTDKAKVLIACEWLMNHDLE